MKRKYLFEDGAVISMPYGWFMSGTLIMSMEKKHGQLKSVTYKGRTVLAV